MTSSAAAARSSVAASMRARTTESAGMTVLRYGAGTRQRIDRGMAALAGELDQEELVDQV
jgi:hypothetical protein